LQSQIVEAWQVAVIAGPRRGLGSLKCPRMRKALLEQGQGQGQEQRRGQIQVLIEMLVVLLPAHSVLALVVALALMTAVV